MPTDTYLCSTRLFPHFSAVRQRVLKFFKLPLPSRLSGSGPLFREAGVATEFVMSLRELRLALPTGVRAIAHLEGRLHRMWCLGLFVVRHV